MAVDPSSTEGLIVRKLVPLASLPSAPLKALCADMVIEEIHDDFLFKKGDTDNRLVYLIKGVVSLQAQGMVVDNIDASDDAAHFALAHQIPRKIDALAKGTVRFLRLSADVINNPPPLVYQEDTGYIVFEEDESDGEDWMGALLKAPVFQQLNPANLQKILMSLEFADFNKGATILEQGKKDAYYYLIKSGTCLITHKPSPDAQEIKLAQICKGNTLGEDALIFDRPRTETITALTDVSLLQLHRQQFISLIKEPSLHFVEFLEMQGILMTGATLLDIRTQQKYDEHHVTGSINLPFCSLKTRFKKLAPEKPVIILGDDEQTNEAAAFFLIKHQYRTLILKGGINDIVVSAEHESIFFDQPSDFATSPPDSDWKAQPSFTEPSVSTSKTGALEARIATLESENNLLKKSYAELNQHYVKAKTDKDAAEKQCRILAKQVEKLTQVLNKFKIKKTQ
jgi:rhodanese-related sulfurtransferase/uncharacterized coiled-coil protein SlyX